MNLNFNILNENYFFKNAIGLSVVISDDTDDKFLLYAINDYEDNDYNFMISYLRKDEDGFDYLEPIYDLELVDFFRSKLDFLIDGGKYE